MPTVGLVVASARFLSDLRPTAAYIITVCLPACMATFCLAAGFFVHRRPKCGLSGLHASYRSILFSAMALLFQGMRLPHPLKFCCPQMCLWAAPLRSFLPLQCQSASFLPLQCQSAFCVIVPAKSCRKFPLGECRGPLPLRCGGNAPNSRGHRTGIAKLHPRQQNVIR